MPSAGLASPRKRLERGPSSDALLAREQPGPLAKRHEGELGANSLYDGPAGPALLPGENMPAYFARLRSLLRADLLSPATAFDRDGLYLYKRPVRSASGDKAALLASCGSVFHHVVLYVKRGAELTALELGPGNQMDITENLLEAEALPGPVVLRPAPAPEPAHLPMMHIAAPCHALDVPLVQQAFAFAQATPYHALRNNCIGFADFAVRLLTGGSVRGAPLAFDALVGQVPAVEPPILALLPLTTGLHWLDVCDGSRLLRRYQSQHPEGVPAPLPGAQPLLDDPAEPAGAADSTCPARPAPPAVPDLAALLGLLPPGALAAAAPGLAPLLGACAAVPRPAQQPADSSGSEDTVGGADLGLLPAPASLPASLAAASSSGSNPALASTGSSRQAPARGRGPALPPRRGAAAKRQS